MSLRDQLNDVRREFGALTPANVVEAATPEDHPLHSRFEWDDAVAGHEYRKVQAGELIRSVRVSYQQPSGPERRSVRAFVSVRRERAEPSYEPVEEVVANEFSRQLLLNECRREWATFERKYGDLKEFAQIVGRSVA